ncbi:hypothetical protein ATANTOWER_022400 [Ataeniobius toweri]|uniref:Uncharacterized protein n=1 Tax=Ataeniobius toweri TaxID=208326 RepID=A0ABU7A813_9TELE|nr:hypothetical protein [Ataeniobius toweri]
MQFQGSRGWLVDSICLLRVAVTPAAPVSLLPEGQLEGQVVALLVQNMERLDEQVKEEADGIYNTLVFAAEQLNKPFYW